MSSKEYERCRVLGNCSLVFFFWGQRDPTSFCTKMLSDVGDMVCCWALRDPGITTSQRLRWSLWFDLNESNYGWVYCIYTYLYILHVHIEHIDVLPWEYVQIIIEWHVLFNIECMIDDTICISYPNLFQGVLLKLLSWIAAKSKSKAENNMKRRENGLLVRHI